MTQASAGLSAGRHTGFLGLRARWLFALMFFWMAVALIPLPPGTPVTGLDASWARALNLAHAQNLVFGRDVIFSFGPLGYLYFPVPGLVQPFPSYACIWAVYVLFLSGVLLIWRCLGNRLVVFISWMVLAGAMLFIDLPADKTQVAFLSSAIGIVALLVSRGDAGSGYLALAGAIAGLMPLFKTNEGIAACAVFYALLASQLLTTARGPATVWRKVAALALVPPLVLTLGFVLVERNISALWAYVTGSLEVATGYSEAMALPGPMYQAVLAVLSLAVLGLGIPAVAASRLDLAKGLLPALVAGFFAFKSGLVRQDDMHADLLQIKLALAGVFLLVCARNARDRRLLAGFVVASFCFGVVVYQGAVPVSAQIAQRRIFWQTPFANLSASWHFPSTWAWVEAQIRPQLDHLRMDADISRTVGGGTVDDVPYELDIVQVNGWRWKPRPVFQSYSAYTPALDQLNAGHLASPASADHILMQWEDIDGRYPLLDDAASWRSLFDHYDAELTRPDLLVLKRRNSPRYSEAQPFGSATGAWQSEIAVPGETQNGFVLMRAEIGKSLYGILRGVLFRNAATYLNATFISGRQSRWRVTRANLVDGAFIAYLPQTLRETLLYFGQPADSSPERVASIRFETPDPSEFTAAIRIQWYSVAFRPGAGSMPEPPAIETVPEAGALTHLLTRQTKGFIDNVNGQPLAACSVQVSAGRPITLSGWAVDEPAHKAAAAVYLDVDGHLFPASYGSSRPDVAQALQEPGYEKSGFEGRIKAGPGSHNVMLRVVNAAGSGYYRGPLCVLQVN
jgi:hypothetical protein